MKNIIIVGAGFGGLQTAVGLSRQVGGKSDVSITLVDERDYHLFTSNLYEVAAAEEELTTIAQLKKSIALPIKEIIKGKNIQFVQGLVQEIDTTKKTVQVGTKVLNYNFLVLAAGSTSDFFGIPGAEQFALPLKTLQDGLRIKNQIEFAIQLHRQDTAKNIIRVVVAGGGYTGVELVTELSKTLDILAFKNNFPREKIELEIVESMNALIPGLNDRLSKDASERLRELGIHIRLLSSISRVDEHFIELHAGEKISYDVLVWSAGVKANQLPLKNPLELDKKGRVVVNEFLQSKTDSNVFALGDYACIIAPNGRPVPSTAQDAWHQARYLSAALPMFFQNKKATAYHPDQHGFIVTMGGKWAILVMHPWYIKGFVAYVVNELGHARYFASLLGLWKAIKYVWFDVRIYSRND